MRFVLNGKTVTVRAHPMKRLLDVLREDCRLTGTKEGCGEGECGACTVLVNGAPVNACLVPFAHVRGARVTTIEGLRGRVCALQEAFVEEGATQCGFCTPGLLVAASALPAKVTFEEMRASLAGNICRCTGYGAIYRAIEKAGKLLPPARRPRVFRPGAGRGAGGAKAGRGVGAGRASKAGGEPGAGLPRRSRQPAGAGGAAAKAGGA